MTVVYVVLEYPVLSQTFITDEVRAVRAAGTDVFVVSLEGGAGADVALGTRSARSPWVLSRALRQLVARPRSAVRALATGPLTPGLRLKLLAAAHEARRRGAVAVHAHFVYRSADGAEVIARSLGLGHSVTAHARPLVVAAARLARRLRAASRIVTVCEYNRRWLEEHHPDTADRIVVIPASTEVEHRRPAERHPAAAADGPPLLVAVGRLVEKKGFDTLLDACARLRRPWRLELVGGGPLEATLRAQAERLGIADRVTFAGAVDHARTLDRVALADVLCGPFRIAADGDRDSMPVVVKEAMAAGVAVVATDVVGVPEMVVDGATGFLVPPDDATAFAEAVDRLLEDPDLRHRFGVAGRRVVEERFDLRRQAERLVHEVFSP